MLKTETHSADIHNLSTYVEAQRLCAHICFKCAAATISPAFEEKKKEIF